MNQELNFSHSDHDEETNRIYYDLESRRQMLSDEISRTASWRVWTYIVLRKKLNQVEQEINDFKWNHGLKMRV
jgi:hypothetical protein